MRLLLVAAFCLGATAVSAETQAKTVTMYGASWCGPCRTVRQFLSQSQVPFTYVDIDTEAGRTAYRAAPGSGRGIPLTLVGRTPVVGANLDMLSNLLTRARVVEVPRPQKKQSGRYGGHLPAWWQAQFRQLRDELKRVQSTIDGLQDRALLHEVRQKIDRLKDNHKILEASLAQLQNDASRVALPRKYRR